jgi:hypothetical protein
MSRRERMESGFDVLIPRLCSLGLGVIVCCCGEVGTVGVIVVTTTANVVKVDVTPSDVTTDANDVVEVDVKGTVGITTSGVVGGGGGGGGGVVVVSSLVVEEVVGGMTGVVEVVGFVEVVEVVVGDVVEVVLEEEVVEVVVDVCGVVVDVCVVVVDVCDVVVLFDCRFANA